MSAADQIEELLERAASLNNAIARVTAGDVRDLETTHAGILLANVSTLLQSLESLREELRRVLPAPGKKARRRAR